MSRCGFCGLVGHNVRACNHELVGLLLLRMRCKTEKSNRTNNWHILHAWLLGRTVRELRMLLGTKYRVKINGTKQKLVESLFDIESREYSGDYYEPNDNPKEKELLIYNILNVDSSLVEETINQFDIKTLFVIFLACLEKQKQPTKFSINLIAKVFDECGSEKECSICYETIENQDIIKYNCGHEFCCECSINHIKSKKTHPECALCRCPIQNIECRLEQIDDLKSIVI